MNIRQKDKVTDITTNATSVTKTKVRRRHLSIKRVAF